MEGYLQALANVKKGVRHGFTYNFVKTRLRAVQHEL